MLIPCYVAHDLIRYRRLTINAALAAAVAVALAGLQYVFWLHDDSYFDSLSSPLAVVRRNVPAYLQTLADLWENGYSNGVRRVLFLGAAAVAAVGYVSSWRARVSVLHLFPPLYLATGRPGIQQAARPRSHDRTTSVRPLQSGQSL